MTQSSRKLSVMLMGLLLSLAAAGAYAEKGALVPAMVGDKWGYMSMDGKMVIEPQFEEAFMFSEGLAAVQIDGNWGYIDKKGTLAIEPQFEGRYAWEFNDGLAVIQTGGKHGAIDKKGNVLFTTEYHINTAFHEGLAVVMTEDYISTLIDGKGEIITDFKFNYIDNFRDGIAFAVTEGSMGVINTKGEFIWQAKP